MTFMNNKSSLLFFFFYFAVTIPALHANIGDFDEFWQQKAEEARKSANETFHPNPHVIVNSLNKKVGELITSANTTTRRGLRRIKGPCKATNPIDRCWRCRPDWMTNRKRLADCVLGFGRKTTGGKLGKFYVVNDSSDDDLINPKPGTLRHAAIQSEPLWIIFDRPMVIRLTQELMVASHKTIDARGHNIHIAHGAGITLQFVHNVIIHGLHIHDIVPGNGGFIRDSLQHIGVRTKSDGDAISLFGASNIWIDHVSLSNCVDGLIDIIMGSTGITISNCHLTHHNEVMLFGANEAHIIDKIMQITVAFNHFGKGLIQRMPRCRFGFIHVVNNDYTHWLMYAIGGSSNPTILSQGNRFIAPPDINAKMITHRDYASEEEWKNWNWRSEGDLMMNGAFFVESGKPISNTGFSAVNLIHSKPGTFASRLTRHAGPLGCRPNKIC